VRRLASIHQAGIFPIRLDRSARWDSSRGAGGIVTPTELLFPPALLATGFAQLATSAQIRARLHK
jgi:hypothetical protein